MEYTHLALRRLSKEGDFQMGAIDTLSKEYMSDPKHFADAINFFLFDGEQVVQASNLKELDPTEMAIVYGNDARVPVQKVRDVAKSWNSMYDSNAIYMILGIENQSEVHYAMAVKNMVYDALNYADQVREARKSHQGETMTGDEFLSGFTKDDKLIPVITLVVYFGSEPWDGETSLHGMFAIKDPRILKYVPDYTINLIQPAKIPDEDFPKFKTELGRVLEYIKYSKNKRELTKRIKENEEFWRIHKDSLDLLNATTHSKLKFKEKEGRLSDMCIAMDEYGNDMMILGYIKRMQDEGSPLEKAIETASAIFGKSVEYVKEVYDELVA